MAGQFKPTLAATADEATIARLIGAHGRLYGSPKIDGVRCMMRGGALVSRSLKPIPNLWVNACLAHPGLEGLDGELVVGEPFGEGVFNRTTGAVRREQGQPDFAWHVFDLCDRGSYGGFEDRLALLRALHAALPPLLAASVPLVEQAELRSADEVAAYEAAALERGYEGVMLRRPDAPYKHGRSTLNEGYLLKVKRFEDAEGVVVGFEERMHNSNAATEGLLGQTERSHRREGMVPCGDLGALRLRDPTGRWQDFSVGSGFTAADRVALWAERDGLIGRAVRYKFIPVGSIDRPRFPIFLGFRAAFDL